MNDTYSEELKRKIINTLFSNKNGNFRPCSPKIAKFKKDKPPLYYEMVEITPFIEIENEDIGERYYCILNDITERPKCKSCNRDVSFHKYSTGYRKFCSQKCQLEYAHSCVTGESYKKMAQTNTGRKRPLGTGRRISEGKLKSNYVHSPETRKKMSDNNWMKGKNKFNDDRIMDLSKKLRVIHTKRYEELGVVPSYNIAACKFFDYFNDYLGVSGQHAMNFGEYRIPELGYYLDYYCPELKLIIEWDEKQHFFNGELKEKDVKRQDGIQQQFPNYSFLRIKESDVVGLEYFDILSLILKELDIPSDNV